MSRKPQKGSIAIQQLLGASNSILADVQRQAAAIGVFQDKLNAILPSPLSDHYIVANIDRNTLTLHADSPAWAARLRFKTPEILDYARKLCATDPPKSIRIKVVPPVSPMVKAKRTVYLSSKSAQLIQETADSISDPALRAALLKLSRHQR